MPTLDSNEEREMPDLKEVDVFMLSHGFVMFPGDPEEIHKLWKVRWYFPGGQTYTDGSKGNMCVDVEKGCFWYNLVRADREAAIREARLEENIMWRDKSRRRKPFMYKTFIETNEFRNRIASLNQPTKEGTNNG